jgi:hypothetical protein
VEHSNESTRTQKKEIQAKSHSGITYTSRARSHRPTEAQTPELYGLEVPDRFDSNAERKAWLEKMLENYTFCFRRNLQQRKKKNHGECLRGQADGDQDVQKALSG